MRKILALSIGIVISVLSMAQPPKGPAKAGMMFGQKTNAENAIAVEELQNKVSEEESAVKVKGKVVDVCTKEGCWLKMQTSAGKMMVKMKDHAFLVPVDINGKEIVVEGTARLKVTSVRELQHYAEDAGKSKEEIAAIKDARKEIVLNANGILVL